MREQLDNTASAVVATKAVAYAGSGVSALQAYFGTVDWAFWISIFVAIGGFAMNYYFARKKDKRDEVEHQEKLKHIRGELDAE